MKEPLGLLLVLAGFFSIAGGVFNWEWFLACRKARTLVKFLGRGGARIFYCLLGSAITILGLLITFGIVASRTS
jgi:hypothetical protein